MLLSLPVVNTEPDARKSPYDPATIEKPAQIKAEFARKQEELFSKWAQQPVPENCQNLSQLYQTFYEQDINWLNGEADSTQKMLQDPANAGAILHANRDQTELRNEARARRIEVINQEIERIRTADPAVAKQVESFTVDPDPEIQ